MIKIANFGGLLLLIYLWHNISLWSLSANTVNIVSSNIVFSLQNIPKFIITVIFIIMVLIYIYSLITNRLAFVMYLISLLLFNISLKISVSMLELESTTTFLFFKVHHIIPLEIKLQYLEQCLMNSLLLNSPEILQNHESLASLKSALYENFNIEILKTLNAKQIQDYACQLLNTPYPHYRVIYNVMRFVVGTFFFAYFVNMIDRTMNDYIIILS